MKCLLIAINQPCCLRVTRQTCSATAGEPAVARRVAFTSPPDKQHTAAAVHGTLRMYRHGVDWDYLEDYWLAFESPVCSLPFHLLAIASSELDQKLDQLNSILCPASCTLLLLAQSYLMFSSCGSGISYRL
jgi:hypothetical protein